MSVEAWVTSAVTDKSVDKAVVLAGSLRRVRTAKKLAVLTAFTVSKDLREKLKEVFDLVVLLEQELPNGLSLEDYAKVQGFSLLLFNKCVYLSSDTLVLRNCDEIFDKYATFAACGNDNDLDPAVYVFTPSLDHSKALGKVAGYADPTGNRTKGHFSSYLNLWMRNHIPNWEKLHEQYNLRLNLKGKDARKCLNTNATIVNFGEVHPLDISKEYELGIIEKFAVDLFWQIHENCVQPTLASPTSSPLLPTFKSIHEPIAVVGLSFRLPGGNTVDEFWDLLINGKEAINMLPPFRWTRQHVCVPCTDKKVEAGFLNVPIDEFDAKFFGLSPKEAVFLDPQQRLLHEVTWEALEDAMIDPLTLRGTQTGVFVGSWVHDYKDIAVKGTDVDFFRVYMGNSIAAQAARLSHFLETTGPSIATESGCSSAIVAVDMACKSLRNRDSDLALACGVNLLLHPFDQDTLSFVIAPDGRCKTFDSKANGFGRAEACCVLLLKRLSDAVKDDDKIWGLIRGSAVAQEGISKSLGTPTIQCESLAMESALKDSCVDAKDVSYIEAHGTGTPVGDPMEVAAIAKAYSKGREKRLVIGSVKTNVGHTESASGITGIIKVLVSMKNEKIPPHINLHTLNPDINLDAIPAEIPLSVIPWPREENKPRIAGVSSFGISGTDGHAIIQEAPILPKAKIDFKQERPLHIMKFSAKCQESLDELLAKYEKIFSEKKETDNDNDFADMAYSANFGRSTFNHRAVLVAGNFSQAEKVLRERSYRHADVQATGSSLCFLFTGQGSQYPNMAAKLYTTSPIFKDNFDKCSDVLQQRFGISIKQVLWGDSKDGAELSRTLYSQTSIFCVEYCLLKLWESWGVKADYVMGHSLGEFAAAVACEALSFDDALMLVAERSRLIDNLPRGKMLVIKADKKTVDQTISTYKESHPQFWVDYAALNSSDQTVVAGESNYIEDFAKYCGEKKLKSIVLAATHAFHSRTMDPMLEAYRKVALTVRRPHEINENAPKYISGMEGKLIEASAIDAEYWVRHTREKVNFIDACKVAQGEGCSLFLEVGPHPVLSALAMMNIEGQSVTCLPSLRRKEEEWVTMLDSLSKLFVSEWKGDIDWKGFDRFYSRNRASIPFYPFNRKSIWIKIPQQQAQMHALIGKAVPTASSQTIYENILTLKKADFALDHVIGNTIVFPGAGFLEMCLAGGHSSVQGFLEEVQPPRRPVVLKSLKIASPLALADSDMCPVQTIITLEDEEGSEMGYAVTVHRHVDREDSGGGRWITHASAKFMPVVPKLDWDFDINVQDIQSSWEPSDNKDFYDKLPEAGLRFGPKFRSLERGWKSEKGALLSVKVPDDYASFLIHPVVADAMIQGIMLWTAKETMKKKLQVPVHIGEFIWFSAVTSQSNIYIYCANNSEEQPCCILLDEGGNYLAYMSQVDFVETTVKLVESMIHQQAVAMPKLWEETWKIKPGPMQNCLDGSGDRLRYPEDPQIKQTLADKNDTGDDMRVYLTCLNQMSRFSTLDGLYKLGLQHSVGKAFTMKDLIEPLGILEQHGRYVEFFLKSLATEGYLDMRLDASSGTRTFIFNKNSPSSSEDIAERIAKLTKTDYLSRDDYRLTAEVGRQMADVLSGKIAALELLFPEDSGKPNVPQFYTASQHWIARVVDYANGNVALPLCQISCENFAKKNKTGEKGVVRVLEVGAGTGLISKNYMDVLVSFNLEFEYYYTDVSPAFFIAAEELLKDHRKSVVFKKFNMEEDPFVQGFCPEYFDCIVAVEVLHVSKHIKSTLQNLRKLLKPNGLFKIVETVTQLPRITFVFGLLDGYWQFEDFDLRPDHVTLTTEKWTETLKAGGFSHVVSIPACNNDHGYIVASGTNEHFYEFNRGKRTLTPKYSWLLFSDDSEVNAVLKEKLEALDRKVIVVNRPQVCTEESVTHLIQAAFKKASADPTVKFEAVAYMWGMSNQLSIREQDLVSLPFLTLLQVIAKMEERPPRVICITQGVYCVDGSDVRNPTPGSITGMLKSASNENIAIHAQHLDLSPEESVMSQMDELFSNLFYDKEERIAFRGEKRLCPRISATKFPNDYITLPSGCDRFQLVLPKTRSISDLEFAYLEPYVLADNEVELQVKCMALNFRDVFTVLKPIPIFEKMNSVGLDFSGVVTRVGSKVTTRKVGDRVIGLNRDNGLSLPSHFRLKEYEVVELPSELTFSEGVTLPAVFLTSVYCLISLAKMKRGETVLLHTASGGVGLCAIQLAQHAGLNIIATAGSTRKRNFLRNLGVQHVFHSRTTDFGKQVLEVTNGKGVDIVLNSITGPGFKEASLDALGKNGRFIEMSKLSVWAPEEVKKLRPDVFYKVVDLTMVDTDTFQGLLDILTEYVHKKVVKPIPFERFDALNIRGALHYLQKAKHIGKIVCVMPEVKVERAKLTATTPLFSVNSTYLITGGLGGIGLEVAKWMLNNGATHIAIASRSKPKPEIATQIELWNKSGKHVEAFSVDVGDFEQCKQLFETLKDPLLGFPQLRGVMHAAGVLSDSTLENQTWDKFHYTYNPKVNGSWNLHDLTKDLLLEHFVLFSSIAAVFGTPGQANHCSSNAFEDALAHYRRSIGLPSISINWGNWGEVGVATEVDLPGCRPISTSQGILALETFLKTQTSHWSVLNIESCALLTKIFPRMKSYMEDKRLFGDLKSSLIINSDEFWQDVDNAPDREGKLGVFKEFIKNITKTILKMDQEEVIDDTTEFQTLGIDSLMMLEMKNSMQNVLGSRMTLTAAQLKDCNNAETLANRLVDILEGTEENETRCLPGSDELKQLIREDATLPDSVRLHAGSCIVDPSDIKTVFITGVTGNLGPYLLRDLSQRPQIKKIYCLVRQSAKASPMERLTARLTHVKLLDEVDMEKVECVQGDITEIKLGMTDAMYRKLAEDVDAVFHSAVKADHSVRYYRAPESRKTHVRTVNVLGTTRVLEFSVEGTLKHVFHASTILTVTGFDEKTGHFFGDWQDVGAFDDLTFNLGYPLSKHICEQLMQQAVERGVPCKAFRFPYMAGDSRTGRCDYEWNHLMLRWLTFLKLGCIHDLPMPMALLPVDKCSNISLDIFFNPNAANDVYNFTLNNIEVEQSLVSVAQEFGIEMSPVDFDEITAKLKAEDDNSPIAPFKHMYEEQESNLISNFDSPTMKWLQKYLEDSATFFTNRKMKAVVPSYNESCIESTSQVMLRDLKYLQSIGVFDKFGIVTNN